MGSVKCFQYIPPTKVIDAYDHFLKKRDIIEDAFVLFNVRRGRNAYKYVAALLAMTEDCFGVPAHHFLELIDVKHINTVHQVLHRLGDYRVVEVDKTFVPHTYSLTLRFEKYLRAKL